MSVLDVDRLTAPFPREAVQQRQGGGGKMLDYVSTDTVIRRLNRHAGEWSWTIRTLEFRNDLCIVTGTLHIPGLGNRDGIGVQKTNERGGEDLVKGASSDALKKASTLFGVALELYGNDVEQEIEQAEDTRRLQDAGARFLAEAQKHGWRLTGEDRKVDRPKLHTLLAEVFRHMERTKPDPLTAADYDTATRSLADYARARREMEQEKAAPNTLLDVPPTAEKSPANYADAENAHRGKAQPNSQVKAAAQP